MAASDERDDHPLEQHVLADDDPLDVVEHLFERGFRAAPFRRSRERSFGRRARGAAGGGDRHGESDAGEAVGPRRVGKSFHDPDHLTFRVEERAAGAARVDGGVELDQPLQRAPALQR